MSANTTELSKQKCAPCEGKGSALESVEIKKYIKQLPNWQLEKENKSIRREWIVKDFMAGMSFFGKVARIAEEEDHHPDLHLTGYRNVAIELSTHAVGGLTENDFILAAKIDEIPINLKEEQAEGDGELI